MFAGESAQFRLYLDGRAAFDRPSILARHVRSGSQLVVDVPANGIAEVVLERPAPRRGWLPLGRVMLETRFPLGLFRAWSYIEPDARCLVYPRPERSPLPPYTGEAALGTLRAQTRAATISPGCAATSAPIHRATSPGRRSRAATSC